VVAALKSGKNVIFTGPPGTAKTTLAQVVAEVAATAGLCKGYVLTTATADWTTYETIGGLRPMSDGSLAFTEGHFLAAIRANEWLVIDELNRSNFDRAFGQLFTVLSGQPVVLPYIRVGETAPLTLVPAGASIPSQKADVLSIPSDWRVIATMNVFDKTLLFEMSYALMRRFAFIEIAAPDADVFEELIDEWAEGDHEAATITKSLLALREIKDIGPAAYRDMVRYAKQSREAGADDRALLCFECFYSYLLPQFEGVSDEEGEQLFQSVASLTGHRLQSKVRETLNTVLGLELQPPKKHEPERDFEVELEAGEGA
jgi:MoxR-like ATPase